MTQPDTSHRARRDYVGTAVPRVEDVPLLTGGGAFVDDIDRPGQLYARVVRSAVAHGRLLGVDARAALARPGVVAAVTGDDVPEVRIPIRVAPTPAAERALQTPLARDRVRYVGEPVAVVVATDPYLAEDAADDVAVHVEPLPVVADVDAAVAGAIALHERVPDNVVDVARVRNGDDVEALMAAATVVERAVLSVQRHTAIPLEARGLIAEAGGGHALTVWGPAKVKHFNRAILASMLGFEPADIRFLEPNVGGGFGPRGEFYPEDFLIPWLALRLGRPVKWIEDRREHFVATNHSREQRCEIEMAADADGRLMAFRAVTRVALGAYTRTHGMVLAKNTLSHLAGPYRWRGFEAEALGVLLNKTPAGTYRGPGQYESAFIRERMVDRLAARLGLDPAEMRRRNLVPVERMPYTVALGESEPDVVYDTGDFPYLFGRLLEEAGYDDLRGQTDARRGRGEAVGVGVAAFVEAGAIGGEEWARIEAAGDGRFVVHAGIASVGQGIATALSQIAADALGVPIDAIEVSHADTDAVPEGRGAFSSRSVVFGGSAVLGAAHDLLRNARAAAAAELGVGPDAVEIADGVVSGPDRTVPLGAVRCEGHHHFRKSARSWSMGAALAVASVDPDTAAATVERCVVACDVGRAINPQIVHAQIVGAAAQGIAGALLEELRHDDEGQPLTTSFMDYLMPTAVELPEIVPVILELQQHRKESANPLGAKGAGEAGIVGIGAAVAGAVADAIGNPAAVTDLPARPDRIGDAYGGRRDFVFDRPATRT
jgi:carbon-monoxide dehydrogenase large subunit